MPQEPEVLDPESDTHVARSLDLRRPYVPTSLNELASMKGEAVEVIEARAMVLATLRVAAIRATSPEDWLLFKAPDEQGGQVVGYLQDSGCDRIRDLYGIEVYGITQPQKETGAEPNVFYYLITGCGRCKLTRQVVEDMEGGRGSTDDFCKGKTGVELALAVRKAARANLDGNITRELAGMKSVPLDELKSAWSGTSKKFENCRRGRGFGTKEERSGGERADAPKLVPPNCGVCGAVAVFRTSARGGFYGCSKYKTHEDRKWSVDLTKWEKDPRSKAAAATPAPATTQASTAAQPAPSGGTQSRAGGLPIDEPPPLTDNDIDFGGGRGSSSRGSRK